MAKDTFSFEEASQSSAPPTTFSFDEALGKEPSQSEGSSFLGQVADTAGDLISTAAGMINPNFRKQAKEPSAPKKDDARLTMQQAERIAEEQATDREKLRKINPGASEKQINALADQLYRERKAPKSSVGVKDRAQAYVDSGQISDMDNAIENAEFDSALQGRLNERFQKAKADPVTGEKIGLSYRPELEAERTAAEARELRKLNPLDRTAGEIAKDTGLQLAEGALNIASAPLDLIDPSNPMSEFLHSGAKALYEKQSVSLRDRLEKAGVSIDKAGEDGVIAQVVEAASQYFADPALASRFVITNLPSMIPSLAITKLQKAAALAQGASEAAAIARATTAGGFTNAALNGGGARGDAYEDIKKTLIDQGYSEKDATAIALEKSKTAGAVGSIVGFATGATGLEKVVAGGGASRSLLGSAVRPLAAEWGGELAEEVSPKITTNVLASQYDNRSALKDVGRTAVETVIGAGPGSILAGAGGAAEYVANDPTRVLARALNQDLVNDTNDVVAFANRNYTTDGNIRPEATVVQTPESKLAALQAEREKLMAMRAAATPTPEATGSAITSPEISSVDDAIAVAQATTQSAAPIDAALQANHEQASAIAQERANAVVSEPVVQPSTSSLNSWVEGMVAEQPEQPVASRTGFDGVYPSSEEALRSAQAQGVADQVEVLDTGAGYTLAPKTNEPTIRNIRQQVASVQGLQRHIPSVRLAGGWTSTVPNRVNPVQAGEEGGGVSGITQGEEVQLQSVAAVAKQTFGINLTPITGLGGFGVALGGNAFVDVDAIQESGKHAPTVLAIATMGHEASHVLQKSKSQEDQAAYRNLQAVVKQYLNDGVLAKREGFEKAEAVKAGDDPDRFDTEYALNEIVGDLNGAMWLDTKFWSRMFDIDNGSTFRRVLYKFMEAATRFVSVAKGSRLDANTFVSNVDAVREAAAQAWASRAKGQQAPAELSSAPSYSRSNKEDASSALAEVEALVAKHKSERDFDQYQYGIPDYDRLAARITDNYWNELSPGAQEFIGSRYAKDWETGESIQAIDRVTGTHIFNLKQEVENNLDESLSYSRGQSNFEVAPDPNDKELSGQWNSLPLSDKLNISRQVANDIVPKVLAMRGAKGAIVEQTGSYLNDTNPSFALKLESGPLSQISMDLGYVLSQDSMMNISDQPFDGGSKVDAVVIELGDKTFDEVKAIYDKLRQAHPEVGGQSYADGAMVVLNYSNTDTSELAGAIDSTLNGEYDLRVESLYSSFPEKKDYDYASSTIDAGEQGQAEGDVRRRLGDLRAEATRLIEQRLEDGVRAPGTSARADLGGIEPGSAGAQGSGGLRDGAGRPDALRGSSERAVVAADVRPSGFPSYGVAREGATSAVGFHFSKQPRRSLSSAYYGTGLRGKEGERLSGADSADIRPRIFFYVDRGNGVRPEEGVGGFAHGVKLNNLYDVWNDPLGIVRSTRGMPDRENAWERAVIEAGFDGYVKRDPIMPQHFAVLIGQRHASVQVAEADPRRSDGKANAKVEPKVKGEQTRREKDELVRRPDGDQLREIVRARQEVTFAAPSFKLQFGEARVHKDEAAAADQVLRDAGSTFQFGEPAFSRGRDFFESPDDIDDLGAFNLDSDEYSYDDLDFGDAKKKEPDEPPSLFDIKSELEDSGFSIAGRNKVMREAQASYDKVSDAEIKSYGLTPEAAFVAPELKENEYGNFEAFISSGGMRRRIEVQPYGSVDANRWVGNVSGLRVDADWGNPMSLRDVSFDAAKNFVERMAAAVELQSRKFDFYKSIPKKAADRVGEFWSNAPEVPGATEFPLEAPELSGNSVAKLERIAKARLVGTGYRVQVGQHGHFFEVGLIDKNGNLSVGQIELIGKPRDVGQNAMVFHAMEMSQGSGAGKAFYNIANTFAKLMDYKVMADPQGLTSVNSVRRTENAMSSAARSKGEMLLEPGWAQRVYGFNGKAKTDAQKKQNLVRLAMAQARNVLEVAPELADLRYDPETNRFTQDGQNADAKVVEILRKPEVRAFSMGRTSLIRAALTNQLLQENVELPETLEQPLLYSRAERWAEDVLAGKSKDPGFVVMDQPPLPMQMFGLGRSLPVVMQQNMVRHLKNSGKKDSVRASSATKMVAAAASQLSSPRAVISYTADGATRYEAILQWRDENQNPLLVALRKDDLRMGGRAISVADIRTMYSKDESLAYLLRHIKDGSKVWLDEKEVARVRDFTDGELISHGTDGAVPPQTSEEAPLRRKGLEVSQATPYSVYSDDALVKYRQGGNAWTTAKALISISDADMKRAGGLAFSRNDEGLPEGVTLRRDKDAAFSRSGSDRMDGEGWLSHKRRLLQDYFLPVLEIQDALTANGGLVNEANDVYRAEERSYGRIEEDLRDFRQKWFDPLIQKAADNNITMDELSLFAYAKHAKERNAMIAGINQRFPDGGSGMTNDEADDILAMFQVNGQTNVMQDLHNDLMAITATTRRVMLEEGLITQDEYDRLDGMFQDYVPLRGFENVDLDGQAKPGMRGGKGFNIRGKETMRALGRRTRAGNIIENIVLDYERAVYRGERNKVGLSFLQLVQDNPDASLWEIDVQRTRQSFNRQTGRVNKATDIDSGEDTVAVKLQGREVYVKIHDERLLRAMRKASKDETGAVERVLTASVGKLTALMRSTLTQYNPAFALVNAVRDIQQGAVSVLDELGGKGVALYLKHYRAALAASARHQTGSLGKNGVWFGDATMDRYFNEYRAAGGTTGGFYGKSVEDVRDEIRNILLAAGASPKTNWEKVKTLGGTKTGRTALKFVQSIGDVLEFAGGASENAARVAAYRAAREMGKTPAEAASIAKNLTTNFNRKGEWGQAINTAYLFFNASVQGTHRTLKALKNGKVQGLAVGMTGLGMLTALLGASFGGDEDDDQPYWDKIPDFEKSRNLIIMLPPGMEMEGLEKVGMNGRYIKIPLPYGFNIFPVLGVSLVDAARYYQDRTQGVSAGKAATNVVGTMLDSMNPFGGAMDLSNPLQWGQAIAPTVVDIAIQQAGGVNGFGTPTAPYKSEFDLSPDSENVNPRQAGGVWHMLARGLNAATGGDMATPGAIDVAPGTLENAVKQVTGGTGAFLTDVFLNIPTKLLESEAEITSKDVPVLRNFYGVSDGAVDAALMYQRRREIIKAAAAQKGRAELDLPESSDSHEVALAAMGKMASDFTKASSRLRKEEIAVALDEEMSKSMKTARRRELKAQRDRLAQEFNAAYMEIMKAEAAGEFDQ